MLTVNNSKQIVNGPIANYNIPITEFLFVEPTQVCGILTRINSTTGEKYNVPLVYGTDFTVTKYIPDGTTTYTGASTGTFFLNSSIILIAGECITMYRQSTATQKVQYPLTGAFPSATHEAALDYLTMLIQEMQENLARCAKVSINMKNFDGNLPYPNPGKAIVVNPAGTGLTLSAVSPDELIDQVSAAITAAQTAVNQAASAANSAASAQTALNNAIQQVTLAQQYANLAGGLLKTNGTGGLVLTDDGTYKEVNGGVVKFNSLGAISSNITLLSNVITTAAFSGTPTINLPDVIDTSKQVTCILDFTTASSAYPIINKVKNLTGTITVTNNNATITGTGTLFTTELQVGDILVIASVEYKIATITSNTALTLTAVYAGTTANGLTVGRKLLRWSKDTNGVPPNAYSTASGIRNKIEFRSIWENSLLYWETSYTTLGAVETLWVQPVGIAGIDGASFGIYCAGSPGGYPAVYAVDNNSGTWMNTQNNNTAPIILDTIVPTRLVAVTLFNYQSCTMASGYIQSSTDKITWVTQGFFTNSNQASYAQYGCSCNLPGYYRYHQIVPTGYLGAAYADISQINLTAYKLVT